MGVLPSTNLKSKSVQSYGFEYTKLSEKQDYTYMFIHFKKNLT